MCYVLQSYITGHGERFCAIFGQEPQSKNKFIRGIHCLRILDAFAKEKVLGNDQSVITEHVAPKSPQNSAEMF